MSSLFSQGSVLTIGNYDGVHRGHQVLIQKLVSEARRRQLPSVVFTFDPHPAKILYPERQTERLFDLGDLSERMLELGVDHVNIQQFNRTFSSISPGDFLDHYIMSNYQPQCLVVGYDFGFGKDKAGNLEFLKNYCAKHQIELHIVSPVQEGDEIVSSSRIRQALRVGDLLTAQNLLGRRYYLRGPVIHGFARGRTIGVPTANIYPDVEFTPRVGVYITEVELKGTTFPAITNIGFNPTFEKEGPLRVESHLLNFNQDIYGETVKVNLIQFLRDEKKFAAVPDLVRQIQTDILEAKRFFNVAT